MLFRLFSSDNISMTLISFLMTIPTVLISLTFHEVAHGFIAYKLGDPTARNLGRLSLNPVRHLSLLGSLSMLLFGFGWANPVPVNTRYFKKPKSGMALTALAGPLMNVLLSFVGVVCLAFVCRFSSVTVQNGIIYYYDYTSNIALAAAVFFENFFYMNLVLAVFNMIPVPPFDGSRIFYMLLPDKAYFGIMKYERYIMIAVLVCFATGIFDISFLTSRIANAIIGLVEKII